MRRQTGAPRAVPRLHSGKPAVLQLGNDAGSHLPIEALTIGPVHFSCSFPQPPLTGAGVAGGGRSGPKASPQMAGCTQRIGTKRRTWAPPRLRRAMVGLGRRAPRHPGAEAHADAPRARRPLTGRGQRPVPPAIVTATPSRRREAARPKRQRNRARPCPSTVRPAEPTSRTESIPSIRKQGF